MRVTFRSAPSARTAAERSRSDIILALCALGAAALLCAASSSAWADSRTSRLTPIFAPAPVSPLVAMQFVEAKTAEDLLGSFVEADYDLVSVREGASAVPRLYTVTLPPDLRHVDVTAEKKEAFIGAMLPLVLMANEEILESRRQLEGLAAKLAAGEELSIEERGWLAALAELYRSESSDIDELLLRVDALPVALTLAQAIVESGWGTSRYAREGNALFGQITVRDSAPGMTARKDGQTLSHRARAFADLMQSVRSYMHNLNTHPAYKSFRAERQRQREEGQLLDGVALAGFLGSYAEAANYAQELRGLIRHNDLTAYERARLADGAVAEDLAVDELAIDPGS